MGYNKIGEISEGRKENARIKKIFEFEKSIVITYYFIIIVLCIVLSINVFNNSFISFDGGWNSQVAAHYAETGEYSTTWPENIVFNAVITTGQTMLLPTAWI